MKIRYLGHSPSVAAIDSSPNPSPSLKRKAHDSKNIEDDEEPVRKRVRKERLRRTQGEATTATTPWTETKGEKSQKLSSKSVNQGSKTHKVSRTAPKGIAAASVKSQKSMKSREINTLEDSNLQNGVQTSAVSSTDPVSSEKEDDTAESEEEDQPKIAAKAREKVQSSLKGSGKDPHPDWKPGDPVPYAALCTTFSLIEMTTKRLVISAHCSLFLRQVLRLTPDDLLPTIQLMINKLAADYAGVELGIGESLIMKAIGETTGRSLQVIKADQSEIGDLGLVAAKSRSNQPTMFKPKALTVRGVLEGLMGIATISGDGAQSRKVAGIKKLLSAADTSFAGKGSKGIDITKDKGGASEAKFIIRFLEGKLRLGLAEKTVLVALAHAMVIYEMEKGGNKVPSSDQLAAGESILKTVYR